ncbi:MAG: CoA transferase [Steroidobacteraceae bacterium]
MATPAVHEIARHWLRSMWQSLRGQDAVLAEVHFSGSGDLPSVYAVSDLAAAAVGCAGAAVAELLATRFGALPAVAVNRRLASLWFGVSLQPLGWTLPSPWDPIAGDYACVDGWIRLHTNAPHHRAAALGVLGAAATREAVSHAVQSWRCDELETAVVERGGCAATMRSEQAWQAHPQGQAVNAEPLMAWQSAAPLAGWNWQPQRERPLQGLRILDLTRVLAGPVATRLLAGFGADVLRIDPPEWDEPAVVADVSLGKRCARLNLRDAVDRATFEQLLRRADVLVHGYRSDALERLGFDAATRRAWQPGLVDVSLDAYGWSGTWRGRRGFDSLVQMSTGIAATGMQQLRKDRPTPLPVQALDHATGYLLAAAVIRGITQRLRDGCGCEARTSLARVAQLLTSGPRCLPGEFAAATIADWMEEIEPTAYGSAHRLRPPLHVERAVLRWVRPASRLGSASPSW